MKIPMIRLLALSTLLASAPVLGDRCSLGYECCQTKDTLEALLDSEGRLKKEGGTDTLRDLRQLHDELIGRSILAKGLQEAHGRGDGTAVAFEASLRKLASSERVSLEMFKDFLSKRDNEIPRPGYSALEDLLSCGSPEPETEEACRVLLEADEERKDFFDASGAGIAASFRAAGSRPPEEIRSEDIASLQTQIERTKAQIRIIQDSGHYKEMQNSKRDLAADLYRECRIPEDAVSVEKICDSDAFAFGEVTTFSADISDVVRSLRSGSRAPDIRKKSREEMDKRARNGRFLASRREHYYIGNVRLGRRPGTGYLLAGALKQSSPAVGRLLISSFFRPDYSHLEYGAMRSKTNKYVLDKRAEYFSNNPIPPCYSYFCGRENPYFQGSLNMGPGSIFGPTASPRITPFHLPAANPAAPTSR